MIDVFLLIFVLVIIGAAVFANVHILLYFQHPEDTNIFCKIVIVASLTLAWLVNVLLPIDVRNSRPRPGVLDMPQVWMVSFVVLATFLVVIVPGVMFYTEVEGDELVKKKSRYVCGNMFMTLLFSGGALVLSYPFLSNAAIPTVEYPCETWQDGDAVPSDLELAGSVCAMGLESSLDIKVGLQIYVIGLLCFIGWFFFVVFGGIGLSAVPLDLILAFRDRPRAISEQKYRQKRKSLGSASSQLIARAEEMQNEAAKLAREKGWALRKKQRKVQSTYNEFKRDCHLLETEFEKLQVSKFHKGENLAVSVTKLLTGILCAILSLVWVMHIILCVVVPQISPGTRIHFLDAVFAACENAGFYPLSVALFAIFSLYLLVCVVKGCLKFGMRVFFVFSVHPMSHKATPLNSILFNVEMVLLTSPAVVQFARSAFADYARLTGAHVIFAAQIKHLSVYSFFFKHNIFIYALLCCFFTSLVYLLLKPRDNRELQSDPKAERQIDIIGAATQGAIEMMPSKQGVKGGA